MGAQPEFLRIALQDIGYLTILPHALDCRPRAKASQRSAGRHHGLCAALVWTAAHSRPVERSLCRVARAWSLVRHPPPRDLAGWI